MRKSILYITPLLVLTLTACKPGQEELNNKDQITTDPTEILEKLESNKDSLSILSKSIANGKDFTMLHLYQKSESLDEIKDGSDNLYNFDKKETTYQGDYTLNQLREIYNTKGLTSFKTPVGVQENAYEAKSRQFLDMQEEDFVYVREINQNNKDTKEKFSLNQSEFAMKDKPSMLANSKKVLTSKYVDNVNNATLQAFNFIDYVVNNKAEDIVINKVANVDKFYIDIILDNENYIENHYVFENGRIRGSHEIAKTDVRVFNGTQTTTIDITTIYTENAYRFDIPRYNTYEKITAQAIMDDTTGNYAFLQTLCMIER